MTTTASRFASIILGLLVGFGVLAPTAAHAEEPYPTPGGLVTQAFTAGDTELVGLTFHFFQLPTNTSVTMELFGCSGERVYKNTVSGSGDFEMPNEVYWARKKFGPQIRYVATFSAPGYATGVLDSSIAHPIPGVGEENCARGNTPTTTHDSIKKHIKKWSVKKGVAKTGKKIRVTSTRVTAGTHVDYKWVVKGKVVDNDRKLKLTKAMKGKRVVMVVTVSRDGLKSANKRLDFGKVR